MAEGKSERWVTIAVAVLSSTVPAYLSYMASQRDVKNVAPVSVDAVRQQLDPALKQLSDQVFELSREVGRIEGMSERPVSHHGERPSASGEATADVHVTTPSATTPPSSTSSGASSPPLLARPRPMLLQLPERPKLSPQQLKLRDELM